MESFWILWCNEELNRKSGDYRAWVAGNYQVNLNTLAIHHTLLCTKCETDTVLVLSFMPVTEMELESGREDPMSGTAYARRQHGSAVLWPPGDLNHTQVKASTWGGWQGMEEGLRRWREELSLGLKQENSGLSTQTSASAWVCSFFISFQAIQNFIWSAQKSSDLMACFGRSPYHSLSDPSEPRVRQGAGPCWGGGWIRGPPSVTTLALGALVSNIQPAWSWSDYSVQSQDPWLPDKGQPRWAKGLGKMPCKPCVRRNIIDSGNYILF